MTNVNLMICVIFSVHFCLGMGRNLCLGRTLMKGVDHRHSSRELHVSQNICLGLVEKQLRCTKKEKFI